MGCRDASPEGGGRRFHPHLARRLGAVAAGLLVVAGTTTVFDASSIVLGSAPPTETLTCSDNWTGGGAQGEWNDAANWTVGVPDGPSVNACIAGNAAVTLSDASISVNELTVSAGSSLTIGISQSSNSQSSNIPTSNRQSTSAGAGTGSSGVTLSAAPASPAPAPALTVLSGLDNGGALTEGAAASSGEPGLTLSGPITNSGTMTVEGAVDVGANPSTTLANDGTIGIAPGGLISMQGTSVLTNGADGLLAFGIDGPPTAASGYGQITGGTLTLGGTGDPVFENGFTPPAHAEYLVDTGSSSGTFATLLGGATADYAHADAVGLTGGAPASVTSTSVTSSAPTGVLFGQPLQLTATVRPSAGADPTGWVSFSSGGVLLARAPLTTNPAGVTAASVTAPDLPVGTSMITASYGGDVLFGASAAAPLTQAVNQDPTTLTLTPSAASPEAGQPVTDTATISRTSSSTGALTGTVSFTDDGAPIAGCQSLDLPTAAPFQTSCSETFGEGATHAIVATYSGDTDDTGSTASLLQALGQIPTQIAVTTPTPNIVFGQSARIVATVTPASAAAVSPGGTITFFDGSTPIGTGTVTTAGGVTSASIDTSSLLEGPHYLAATYSGDPTFATSTSATSFILDVAEAATTVTIVTALTSPAVGEMVVFTAFIASSATGETGTVQFADNGLPIGAGSVSGGQATFETSSLAIGTHPITAVYEGDDNFVGGSSTNTIPEVIAPAPTSTDVTSSHDPGLVGQTVTYAATVSAVAPGSGTPSGSVSFSDDGSPIASCQGVALPARPPLIVTCPQSYDTTATHNVTATYGGDASFTSSGGAVTESLSPVSTTTALASSPSASTTGQSVTLTATVAPTSGTANPDGSVSFALDGTPLGTSVLSTTDGITSASMLLTSLPLGSDSVTASYSGSAAFLASASPGAAFSVTKAATTIDVLASANPTIAGQPTTLTATVFPETGSGETGQVTFFENNTAIGTSPVSNGQATLAVFSQLSGAAITADYSGDNNFIGSTMPTPLSPTTS